MARAATIRRKLYGDDGYANRDETESD